jgi:hypothetical protein
MPVGLAWYTRESWHRLVEVADDRSALDDTFEDWERQALSAFRKLQAAGANIHKVVIDIDALVAWCRAKGHKINGAARAEFASILVEEVAGAADAGPS